MGCALVLRALQLPLFDPATPLTEVLDPTALLVVMIVEFCVCLFDCRFAWWADTGPYLGDMQSLESIQVRDIRLPLQEDCRSHGW